MSLWDELSGKRQAPLIVAEIGAKYGGLDTVKSMVTAAKAAGADCVKFQTYQAQTISTPGATFTFEDGSVVPQFDFFKQYELTLEDHLELDRYCAKEGIRWFSTPSHPNDLDLLERFDPPASKLGSDDLTNLPFIRKVAETGRLVIMSTGMCRMEEIEKAVETVQDSGNGKLVLLHCVVSYPSRPEEANLKMIPTLRKAFDLPVGLSDHTTDELTSVLATQLGAVMIEKHFTLDHALKLADHQASLDPEQFANLVRKVRLVPQAMGDGVKTILPTEKKWRAAGRKSIFVVRDVAAGEALTMENLAIRRPADGIHPHELEKVLGRKAVRAIPKETLLQWDMI